MWEMPRLSCCRTSRRASPAKSSMSIRASATSWPGWAARLLLLRAEVAHFDVGAAAQARHDSLVLGGAERRADSLRDIGCLLRSIGFADLRDPQQDIAVGR